MRRSVPRPLMAGISVVAASVALGGVPITASASGPSEPAEGLEGELTVFAAASLGDAFEAVGEAFGEAHPDVDLVISFASSSDLVNHILEGAPADVYTSADAANMDRLVDGDGAAGAPQAFATNSLAIIVEPGNPQRVTGVEDLADDPGLIVVSCAPEVPVGAYTAEVFAKAGVEVEIDSYEENVRAVSEKVQLGEADAGLVYATDVGAAGDAAEGVEIPAGINVVAEYLIAATADAGEPVLAAAFIDFVLGNDGQAVLAELGFGTTGDSTGDTAP